jgi:hypothetical protein
MLKKPFPNGNSIQCGRRWLAVVCSLPRYQSGPWTDKKEWLRYLFVAHNHGALSNFEITDVSSGILNGFVMKPSTPASSACFICSARAFAETAIIGICLTMSLELCKSRMRWEQVNPSMMGISISMRIMCTSGNGVVSARSCCLQAVVLVR